MDAFQYLYSKHERMSEVYLWNKLCTYSWRTGTCLTGKHFGAPLKRTSSQKSFFTTAMTGYTETLTDPSYYGQMAVQTFPLIGNYGVNPKDFESKGIHMSAYITREWRSMSFQFQMSDGS